MADESHNSTPLEEMTTNHLNDDDPLRDDDDISTPSNGAEESPLLPPPTLATSPPTKETKKRWKLRGKNFAYLVSIFACIGGFLFGYDTGVVSGAMLPLRREFELTTVWVEGLVSATIAAAAVSAPLGGVLADIFGRRSVILVSSLVFAAGAVLVGAAGDKIILLGGRIVLGVGIGLTSTVTPIYLAEVAPAKIRGRFVTLFQILITFGILVASLVDTVFIRVPAGWRLMMGVAAIPALVQFVAFLFLPETPRWLVLHGREPEARSVLNKIRDDDVDLELNSIVDDNREAAAGNINGWRLLLKMWRHKSVRRALIIGCGLEMFQQICGINTVIYYSATIIRMSGVTTDSAAVWWATLTTFINFVFTFVGLALVDRIGRRNLVLVSVAGVTASLVLLATGFYLSDSSSPAITSRVNLPQTPGAQACVAAATCNDCVNSEKCGFCYENNGDRIGNTSCLPVSHSSMPMAPYFCNATNTEQKNVWAFSFCPSPYAWISTAAMVLYLMFFAPGLGPMAWTINAEIYPTWARSMSNGLAASTNWSFNLLISMTFLTLSEALTPSGAFLLYAAFATLGFLFLFFTLPETRGKSLEEIEQLFATGSLISNRGCGCDGGGSGGS